MSTNKNNSKLIEAGLAQEYIEQNQVKINDGNIFIKWKGSRKFVLVDRTIGEFVIAMWAIGKEEYSRRKACIENGRKRWW